MILLHTMSFAGSIAVVLYILSYMFTKRHLPNIWHKLYLTLTIFLFLVPFQYCSMDYANWIKESAGLENWYVEQTGLVNESSRLIYVYKNIIYTHNKWRYILSVICIMVSICLLLLMVGKYFGMQKGIQKYSSLDEEVTAKLRVFGRWAGVKVYICDGLGTPVSVGLLHGKIVLPDTRWTEDRLKDVLCHELVHIRSKDNLIKMFLLAVVILNFYNPLVYYLWRRWNITAELYCDDRVCTGKCVQEINEYANMVVDFAAGKYSGKLPYMGLRRNVSEKQLKERIRNMKKTKRTYGVLSKVLGTMLIVAGVFVSSLTAAAYQPGNVVIRLDQEYEKGDMETFFDDEGFVYLNELDGQLDVCRQFITMNYDVLFVDEEGIIYFDVHTEEDQVYALCSHTYVDGAIAEHKKAPDGSCKTDYYSGKKCSKCGDLVYGEYTGSRTYSVCPH